MKVLYCTRIFSGLENSLIKLKWKPTGVPTIFKLLENLEKKSDLYILFLSKDSSINHKSNWTTKKNETLKFKQFKNNIDIISGKNYFNFLYFEKLKILLRDIRHFIFLYFKYLKVKPDIIYFDNSNILFASLFTKFSSAKVVLRIMGVYPFMKNVLKNDNLKRKIFLKAYSSKYKLIICSQDGSGVEPWLKNIIHPETKISILMNGVDKSIVLNRKINKNNNKKEFRVLFIGKIESYKGADTFIESILKFEKEINNNIKAIVIGTGSIENKIKNKIIELNKEYLFDFHSRVSHNQIYEFHNKSDIYVSLNEYGNLSNANLEAINACNCIIMPEPDIKSHIDVFTKNFLGDSVIYVSRKNTVEHLLNIYEELYNRRNLIIDYNDKIKFINKKIYSWPNRIDKEIEILKEL